MKKYSFSTVELPYRLDTVDSIQRAMTVNLLELGHDYQRMMTLANRTKLYHPPAFILAEKRVTKSFIKITEEKIHDLKVSYRQVNHLSSMDQYPLIEKSMPWIQELIRNKNIFQYLLTFPPEIKQRCRVQSFPDSPSMMYDAMLSLRRFVRVDMIVYIKSGKTSCFSLLQLKQVLVALTVFETDNHDILESLKNSSSEDSDSVLYQNAMAELLFARIPKTIRGLIGRNPADLGKKLRSRMVKLNLTPRQIANLMGYLKTNMSFEDTSRALDRIADVAMRMNIIRQARESLQDYIISIKKNLERVPSLYKVIFLSGELETWQKIYKPTKIMQMESTLEEKITGSFTESSALDFYPTKDYLDLLKSKISHDCTENGLGENQLLTPSFFNIRIFQNKNWIGNIYMLDFSEHHETLIIDRIQIPRDWQVLYYHFFDHLKDVLIEMFADVDYKYILMPVTISNHGTIQKIFNDHKKGLRKKTKIFDFPFTRYFESLNVKTYYVMHEKSEVKAI